MGVIQANLDFFYNTFIHKTSVKSFSESDSFKTVPQIEISESRYTVRLANSSEEIDAALRLRFEVFNLELGEGLETSFITGRDRDEFDSICHHLIVIEHSNGAIVGTYRLQTMEMAKTLSGFYCAGEFNLENLPTKVLTESLEIGRACIAHEHRNTKVLFLLWKGLAAYAQLKGKRYLFGCCSLTSQNPTDGTKASAILEKEDHFHPAFSVKPREEFLYQKRDSIAENSSNEEKFELPKLFRTYLRFGAKVCSKEGAIDQNFKTIDFFVIFDMKTMDRRHRELFLG